MQNRRPFNNPYDFQPTTTTYAAAAVTTAVVFAVTEAYNAFSAYRTGVTLFNKAPEKTPESNEPDLFRSFGFGAEYK